jgi:hypothetical protein
MSTDATRAKTIGLLIIAAVILLIVLLRWGGHLAWSLR